WAARGSVAGGEPAAPEAGVLDLVDQGDREVLGGDAGVALGVGDEVVGTGAEGAGTGAGRDDGGRARVGPVDGGDGPVDLEGLGEEAGADHAGGAVQGEFHDPLTFRNQLTFS